MSKTRFVLALAAPLALGLMAATPSSAAPMVDRGVSTAVEQDAAKPEAVRWVCNAWGRCWWRPGPRYYRPYGFYRPRPYYRPYRAWRRW